LFVWGRRDTLVPIAFARHVADALPQARHLELECGHVPQVELPRQTHDAVGAFLARDATMAPVDGLTPAVFGHETQGRGAARVDAARGHGKGPDVAPDYV
jgi:hypothetical protein